MTLLRKLNRLDLVAGTASIILTFAIVALIAYVNWIGISVSLRTANPRDAISPYEELTLVFSQAVDPGKVENGFHLEPTIPGKLTWENNRTAHFAPAKAYLGSVNVRLTPGQLGTDSEWLRNERSWALIVRTPRIVYMNYADPKNELMSIDPDETTPRQLTSTNGRIFDFDVAPSGDMIVYTTLNEKNGFDLWLVGRDGQNPHRLLDCDAGQCSTPTWSPDGKSIAYTRESAGLTPNSPIGAPRPWVVNVETGENAAVFADPQSIGYGVLWSPDGNWLATYDGIAGQIKVVNRSTSEVVVLPNRLATLGSWSPDSTSLIYPDQTTGTDNILKTYIYRADFKTGETSILLGEGSDTIDYMFSNPAWSPGGDQIALSLRPSSDKPDRQVWVIHPDRLDGPMIAQEPGFTYNSYRWDPWGIELVVQQSSLKRPYTPEIGIWGPIQGYRVIAGKGIFPHWLP